MGEEEGVYPHGGVLLSSEPVPQYMCIKLPKADNNDRAHKNDVNTLSSKYKCLIGGSFYVK